MEKKNNTGALQMLLWAAVLIALTALALAIFRPTQPAVYADAVYVMAEVTGHGQ